MERKLTFFESTINFLQASAADQSKSYIGDTDDNVEPLETEFDLPKEHPKGPNVSKYFKYQIHDFDKQVLSEDWSDDETYVKVRDFRNFQMGELETAGILTDRLIEVCSTRLRRAPYPGKYILCNCNLQRKNLVSIDLLEHHPYLQYLDLSRNQISTLKPLENLPFLKYLNASHNALTILLDFKAPVNLTYVDCSNNTIESIPDLTDFWSLVYLDISYNMISEMNGFTNLQYLNYLNLSYNNISCVSHLPKRNLEILCLDHNIISSYTKDVLHVYSLEVVSMDHNKLSSLEMFAKMSQLKTLSLFHNEIKDLYELVNLRFLPVLNSLNIQENPVYEKKKFREICLFLTPSLKLLDGELIDTQEKGFYDYLYSNNSQIHANYMDCMMEILRNLNVQDIDSSIFPCYRYNTALLLIVGPTGSGKKFLVASLLEKYSFFKQAVSYTTRRKCNGEVEGREYYFVSNEDFQKLELDGKFMSVSLKYGSSFGISFDELRKVSEEPGILLIQCDLVAALQMKSKFVNIIMVLAMPRDIDVHKEWLREKFYYSHWINNHLSAYLVKYKAINRVSMDSIPRNVYIQQMINDMLKFLDDDFNEQEETLDAKIETSYNSEMNISEISGSKIMSILKRPDTSGFISSMSNESVNLPSTVQKSVNISDHLDFEKSEKTSVNPDKKISFLEHPHSLNAIDNDSTTTTTSTNYTKSDEMEGDPNQRASDYSDISYRRSDFFDCYYQTSAAEDDVILFDYFIAKQARSRKKYLDIYLNYPGFFVTMVDTMDHEETMKQLHELVKMWVKYHIKPKTINDDCVQSINCPEMMKEKMDMIFEMF